MAKKYFGLVEAEIQEAERRVVLSFRAPGKQPLPQSTRKRCLIWALDALQPYTAKGFVISVPEARGGHGQK